MINESEKRHRPPYFPPCTDGATLGTNLKQESVPLPLYYPRSIRWDIIEIFPETYSTCTTERNDERQSCRKMGFNFVVLCWHQAEEPTQHMAIVPRDRSEWVQGIRLVDGSTARAVGSGGKTRYSETWQQANTR